MSGRKTVKLAFISAEPKTGSSSKLPPVILHHGMTDSKERWIPIMQKLADDTQRKVFAIDARNHGDSERSDEFDFSILVEDLEQFMISKGIAKATIIGHSMGGWVAMLLALRKPERVEKIVIEDSPCAELSSEMINGLLGMLRFQLEFLKQFPPEESEESVQDKLKDYILQNLSFIFTTDLDREFLKKKKFPIKKTDKGYEPKANIPAIIAAMEDTEKRKLNFSGVYEGDILFLCGGKSVFKVLDQKDHILQLFPKAQFEVYEEVGHEILGICPDKYYSRVLAFL